MSALERRYRFLLRAYPASYRRDRGEEIIGTLLQAVPSGRNHPGWRDAWALLLGGLRVHAAQNQRLSTPANLRLAAMLTLAIVGAIIATSRVADVVRYESRSWPMRHFFRLALGSPASLLFSAGLALAAIVLIWFVPRFVAAALLLSAAVVGLHQRGPVGLESAAVLLLLATLTAAGRERPPRSWLWLVAILPAYQLLVAALPARSVAPYVGPPLWLALLVLVMLWTVVDARPAIAAALLVGFLAIPGSDTSFQHSAYLAGAVVLAALAIVRLRRQAGL